jgi:Cu(I)-responsive transcriptional regulator
MSDPMNIGEAAAAAGVTAKMIRHYESLGLIPEAARTEAGYRQYTAREVSALRFIRQSRSLGFPVKQIAKLLTLWADAARESREVKALASEHLAELDRKMQEMAQMKTALEALANDCRGDHRADCPILEQLSGSSAPPMAPLQTTSIPAGRREAAARRPRQRDDVHHGLLAWMQSVNRSGGTEHAWR